MTDPQLSVVSALAQPLHSFWSYFSTLPHSIPTDLGRGSSSGVIYFSFSYYSWVSQGKNSNVICHSLLQWTIFCPNSPLWPVHLGWPWMAWLIASLSYTRLWSMWSFWLAFCDFCFHSKGSGIVVLAYSVCLLMDEDKRQASWWETLTVVKTGPYSGRGDK